MKYIDVNNKNYKKQLKNTKKYILDCDKNNKKIKYNLENLDEENKKIFKQIETAINEKNIHKRYSFIYDKVCEYIDESYLKCNYCDFRDNVCIYFREHNDYEHKNGCCYSVSRGGLCSHLINNKCNIKSISCKLYSCEVLRKNKIYFKMKDIPLIKYFFNIKQKYYIKYSFFKDKNYVLYKLIENRSKNEK